MTPLLQKAVRELDWGLMVQWRAHCAREFGWIWKSYSQVWVRSKWAGLQSDERKWRGMSQTLSHLFDHIDQKSTAPKILHSEWSALVRLGPGFIPSDACTEFHQISFISSRSIFFFFLSYLYCALGDSCLEQIKQSVNQPISQLATRSIFRRWSTSTNSLIEWRRVLWSLAESLRGRSCFRRRGGENSRCPRLLSDWTAGFQSGMSEHGTESSYWLPRVLWWPEGGTMRR